jgi:two-component system, NarL family, nitrate/nitrite response regulator NarL
MPGSSNIPIRIVLLDLQTLFRAGLRRILEAQVGMEVVGEADNISDSLELIDKLKPDIILFDLNLMCLPDLEIVPTLIKASGGARLILVTGTTDQKAQQKAVEDGVVGVITKNQSPETLLKAIEKVHAGEVWLERSLIATVLSRLSRGQGSTKPEADTDSFNHLSEREKEVVKLIGQGYKNKKISQELCISETTVRHHLTSIYSKLGVTDRLELLVYAHRHGLVTTIKK